MLILRGLFAALAAGALAGSPELPAGYLKVPLVPQAQSWSCGAAVMMSVLLYWGKIDQNEGSLYAELKTTPEQGTDPLRMRALALRHGLKAELKLEQSLADIEAGLSRGETVILDLQAWASVEPDASGKKDFAWESRWEDGHYVVLVATDSERLFVMDPSAYGRHAWLPKAELASRWRDYEERDGKRVEHHRLALYIQGDAALPSLPPPPVRLE